MKLFVIYFYLLLSKSFCEEHKDYCVDNNCFNYAVTVDGWYVASSNSLNDFPELFLDKTIRLVRLDNETDFPKDTLEF